jgi:hypothetical protein
MCLGKSAMRIDGLPVKDAKKKLPITINARDVRRGNNNQPTSCAAAQACLRQSDASAARVHLGRTYLLIDGKHWLRFKTPASMRSEIIAFDRGGKFATGEYVLGALQPTSRATGKRQGTVEKPTRNRKTAKKRRYHAVTDVRSNAHAGVNYN